MHAYGRMVELFHMDETFLRYSMCYCQITNFLAALNFFLEIKALEHAANYLSNFLKHFIVLKK